MNHIQSDIIRRDICYISYYNANIDVDRLIFEIPFRERLTKRARMSNR